MRNIKEAQPECRQWALTPGLRAAKSARGSTVRCQPSADAGQVPGQAGRAEIRGRCPGRDCVTRLGTARPAPSHPRQHTPQSGKSPPVFTLSLVFHSLRCRFTAASPHPGRHLDFANQTCPACSVRRAVWRDCLQTAELLAAPRSRQLQSQRVALPAAEEPRPLPDLRLIFPRCPSWNPSPICIEGLVLPTSGRPRPGQGESSMARRR